MAPIRASSANGLVRNSAAPAFMARTVIGMSPYPVMKMIGMPSRSPAICACSSRPLRSGRLTSRMRQLGVWAGGRARKSCAEAKHSARQPSMPISASSDSRTETSSSTTNTIGVALVTADDLG